MILKNIKCICAALVLVCANASATLITYETRDLNVTQNLHQNSGANADNHGLVKNKNGDVDYLASWDKLSAGTSNDFLGDFVNVQPGKDKFTHIQIDLSLDRDSTNWVFEFGLDAGLGMAVYLDNELVKMTGEDLWWRKSWNNSDVFSVELDNLTRENKVVDIYWAEHCCDGPSSIRFKDESNKWKNLSVDNIAAASIPEPTSIALLGLGLLGLVSRRRMAK